MPNPQGGDSRGPQFGRPPPGPMHGQSQAQQASTSSNKGGLLSFLLPVYAVGIGVYMMYTLYKVFKKEDPKEEVDSDYDEIKEKRNYTFKEHNKLNKSYAETRGMSGVSEETDDELNDYARYNDVDPEYLRYLKEVRRQKRLESKGQAENKKDPNVKEVTLTPGSGLTSITNTNVLMNDTLERMKHQLNKINVQLVEVERKGNPLQDPELDSLKLQLTQTEMQMSKIMTIVNNVSETLDMQAQGINDTPRGYEDDEDGEDSDDFDEEDEEAAYHQRMLAHSLQMQYMDQGNNKEEQVNKNTLRNRRKNQKKLQKKLGLQQEENESISSSSISSANAMQSNNRDQNSSDDDESQEAVHVNQKRNVINSTNKQGSVNNGSASSAKNQQKNAKKKQKKKNKAKQHES